MERVEMNAVIEPKDEFDLTKYFISQTKQSYRNQEDGQEENQGPDPDIPSAGDDTVYPADEPFFDIADDGNDRTENVDFWTNSPRPDYILPVMVGDYIGGTVRHHDDPLGLQIYP